MVEKFSCGEGWMNKLLEGGYDSDSINMIFGPAASGKTTCCLLAGIEIAKNGEKILFIDTENGFSVERLKQLCGGDVGVMDNFILLKMNSFGEQCKKFEILEEIVNDGGIKLIIVDTMGSLYRKSLKENVYGVNKEMDMQFRVLKDIINMGVSVLLTNQVYDNLKGDGVQIVGGEMFRNWSGLLIELKKLNGLNRIFEVIKPLPKKIKKFKIEERGFTPL